MAEMTQKKEGPVICLGLLKQFNFLALPEISSAAMATSHGHPPHRVGFI